MTIKGAYKLIYSMKKSAMQYYPRFQTCFCSMSVIPAGQYFASSLKKALFNEFLTGRHSFKLAGIDVYALIII